MIQYSKIIVTLVAGFFAFKACLAQQSDLGSWSVINVKKTLNDKWSAYSEFQLRGLSMFDRFYYYELKAGLTYSLSPSFNFTAGTGIYNTFKEGVEYENYSKQKEVRLWEQFIFDQKLSVVEIEHRYRIEQRFKDKFENRFRYRLNLSVPINKREITTHTLFTSVYDELFFADKLPYFSRNRFYAGLGYVFTKNISLQSGWLRQIDFNKDWQRRKSYFLLSASYKL